MATHVHKGAAAFVTLLFLGCACSPGQAGVYLLGLQSADFVSASPDAWLPSTSVYMLKNSGICLLGYKVHRTPHLYPLMLSCP